MINIARALARTSVSPRARYIADYQQLPLASCLLFHAGHVVILLIISVMSATLIVLAERNRYCFESYFVLSLQTVVQCGAPYHHLTAVYHENRS